MKKPALGKGLGAFMPTDEENVKTDNNSIIEVDINSIEPGKGQPRTSFDKEKIESLAESIKEYGVIQPLLVTKKDNCYFIIAGERRWRAARLAGLTKIPVIIREATSKEIMELALIENIQREDLNPIEEALAYQKLMSEYNMTQEELSSVVGKSRPAIANSIRLINFSDDIRSMISSGEINVGQARPLLTLDDSAMQLLAARYIVKEELNSRQAEDYVKKLKNKADKVQNIDENSENEEERKRKKVEIKFIQEKLRKALGTKVKLEDRSGKGKIIIEYYTDDERERLFEELTSLDKGGI